MTTSSIDEGRDIGATGVFRRPTVTAATPTFRSSTAGVAHHTACADRPRYRPDMDIGVNIITFLSQRLQEAERELEAMAYQRVGQRLARKLIDLAQRFGVETVRGTLIEARLTQQELAEMIGTTRETLAHTLADFRRRDLLDTAHHQVVIRDAERLADVAQDGEGR